MAGGLSQFRLAALPDPPKRAPLVRGAVRYLVATHESVTGILDTFTVVRETASAAKATAKGRLSRDQVDLLRAALVFTSSGLDAACHRLVIDCAPELIDRGGGAKAKFEEYLRQQLAAPSPPDGLFDAVAANNPRTALITRYTQAKSAASYQGSGDLQKRVRELLGIPAKAVPNARLADLDPFFTARNQIVHSLDYQNPTGQGIARNHRAPAEVVRQCDQALAVASDLIAHTAAMLR